MEYRFEAEFPIRHRGRLRHEDGATRPDYKILQYDWNAVKIKTNNYDDTKFKSQTMMKIKLAISIKNQHQ